MIVSSLSSSLGAIHAFESDMLFLQNIIAQLPKEEQEKLTAHVDHLMTEQTTQIQHMGQRIQTKMFRTLEEQDQKTDHREELDILHNL